MDGFYMLWESSSPLLDEEWLPFGSQTLILACLFISGSTGDWLESLILYPSYSAHTVPILNDSDILLDSYCTIEYSIILGKQLVLIAQEEVTDLVTPEGVRCRSNHWDLFSSFDMC